MKMRNLTFGFVLSVICLTGCDTLKDDNALEISIAEEIRVKPNSNALFNLHHALNIDYDRIEIISQANYGTVSLPNINFFNYKSGMNVDADNDLVIIEASNDDKLVGKALLTYEYARTGENDCGTFPFPTEYTVNSGDTVKFILEFADIFCESKYESTDEGLSTGAFFKSDPNNIISGGLLDDRLDDKDIFEFHLITNPNKTGRGAALIEVFSFNTKNPTFDPSKVTNETGSIAGYDPSEVVEYHPFLIEIEAN